MGGVPFTEEESCAAEGASVNSDDEVQSSEDSDEGWDHHVEGTEVPESWEEEEDVDRVSESLILGVGAAPVTFGVRKLDVIQHTNKLFKEQKELTDGSTEQAAEKEDQCFSASGPSARVTQNKKKKKRPLAVTRRSEPGLPLLDAGNVALDSEGKESNSGQHDGDIGSAGVIGPQPNNQRLKDVLKGGSKGLVSDHSKLKYNVGPKWNPSLGQRRTGVVILEKKRRGLIGRGLGQRHRGGSRGKKFMVAEDSLDSVGNKSSTPGSTTKCEEKERKRKEKGCLASRIKSKEGTSKRAKLPRSGESVPQRLWSTAKQLGITFDGDDRYMERLIEEMETRDVVNKSTAVDHQSGTGLWIGGGFDCIVVIVYSPLDLVEKRAL
ncbi:hypothetical protein RIF29_21771 [Crotalaria pallida]|uniref:Uncharacterized protein n=1 Tax=Crotalaria pallida TaxID=3830 RepID=A0AAN9F7G2_CROPI